MLAAKKSFGQHFLRDASIIAQILEAARPEDFSLTVEVGPGQGAVTDVLLPVARRLVLIEADRDLIPSLQTRYPKAEVVRGDAARVDYRELLAPPYLPMPGEDTLEDARRSSGSNNPPPAMGESEGAHEPWLLVGNLPYNAANAIIMHALESPEPPERMVVMVQKEVGERLLGLPGSRGLLTVAVQLYADVTRVCNVKPGAFVPPPAVDSMVVMMTVKPRRPNTSPPAMGESEGAARATRVIAVAKAGFANRRKQLHGNLAEAGIAPSEATKHALESLGLPVTARAEELSIAQWVALCSSLRGASAASDEAI